MLKPLIVCPLGCPHPPFASVEAASKHVRRRECANAAHLEGSALEKAIKKSKDERKRVVCPTCGICFASKSKLREHSKVRGAACCQLRLKELPRKDDKVTHEAAYRKASTDLVAAASNTVAARGDLHTGGSLVSHKRLYEGDANEMADLAPLPKMPSTPISSFTDGTVHRSATAGSIMKHPAIEAEAPPELMEESVHMPSYGQFASTEGLEDRKEKPREEASTYDIGRASQVAAPLANIEGSMHTHVDPTRVKPGTIKRRLAYCLCGSAYISDHSKRHFASKHHQRWMRSKGEKEEEVLEQPAGQASPEFQHELESSNAKPVDFGPSSPDNHPAQHVSGATNAMPLVESLSGVSPEVLAAPHQTEDIDPAILAILSEEIIKDRKANEFAIDIPGVNKTKLITLAMRGESCRIVQKLRLDLIRHRFRFLQLKHAHGRGFSIFALMLACLPPTKMELLEGIEDVAQHKKDATVGTTTYTQYSARAEITDGSIESPRRLMFISRHIANIPPSLGNNNVVIIGLDNIRLTKGSNGDYYTANDDSGWAIFSPEGDLMCSFQWPMDERLNVYLAPVLEYAKEFKGWEAKESDLYFYEDSKAVPTRGEHDIVAEENKFRLFSSQMNTGQRQALSAMINCLHDGSGGVVFLDGPAGTGKTFILQAFISYLYSTKKKPIIVASTGLAASLYEEGSTAHSMFRIPFCLDDKTVCSLGKSWRTKLFREADILIWDEAVCIEKDAIEAVERGFKELRADQRVFGGLLVVFCGDFRQVLPVMQKSAVQNTIQQTTFWHNTKILRLSENVRAKDDKRFATFLMDIGNGTLDSVTIPPCCQSPSLATLIDFVFPQFEDGLKNTKYFENRAILATTNRLVDSVNDIMLKRIARKEKIYTWVESTKKRYKNEYIHERIALKVGCPVMILANLGHGLCNGTRMICMELGEETILGKVLTGVCAGKDVEISRIITEDKQQFPVALCFAMTINKAQGQTLDRVGLYLAAPVFAHGQLYCAFSRARSLDGVKVFAPGNALRNIVHKSILL